jgi:hypothetical protein
MISNKIGFGWTLYKNYGKKVNVKKPGLRFLVHQFIQEMSDVSILTAHAEQAVSN